MRNFSDDPMSERTIDPPVQRPLVVTCDLKEYDISTCDELAKVLELTYNAPRVVVDMSQVEYLDSTSLSKLVIMRKKRGDAGFPPARLVITSHAVRRLFKVTSFDKIWRIFDTVEAALEADT
jgi:anti-anti-sigma factor